MRNCTLSLLLVCFLLPLVGAVEARDSVGGAFRVTDPDTLPSGALYRYRKEDGSLVISGVLEEQAVQSGYEVIDSRGRVLRTVGAAIPEHERRRMQQEMRVRQQDNQLRRLYPTPGDAERARDRQIASMRLNIDYARNIIIQLDGKLSAEVTKAAEAERAGRPIPEVVQADIDLYTRQIREQEEKIESIHRDIADVGAEFEPIITRLREIEEGR